MVRAMPHDHAPPDRLPTTPRVPVRVWDLPTRLFHWALAAAVVALVVTGQVGGNALIWHMRLGLSVGALLLFRLLWGVVGGRWSRFDAFVPTPGGVLRYLRDRPRPDERFDVGHNPLGSLSVLALLALLALQVGTGLVADDEIATTGPLNRFVANATASLATGWHTGWGRGLLIGLALLHVAAIGWYAWRRRGQLVPPMWHGDKLLPAGTPPSRDTLATRALALVLAGACAALAAWVATLA
jgi:cytochrome b